MNADDGPGCGTEKLMHFDDEGGGDVREIIMSRQVGGGFSSPATTTRENSMVLTG